MCKFIRFFLNAYFGETSGVIVFNYNQLYMLHLHLHVVVTYVTSWCHLDPFGSIWAHFDQLPRWRLVRFQLPQDLRQAEHG